LVENVFIHLTPNALRFTFKIFAMRHA